MTTKEKIIRRLNKGFGFNIPIDANWKTHERAFRNIGGLSWYISDIRCMYSNYGAAVSATETLKWKRWVIDREDHEICEYFEHQRKFYEAYDFLIETTDDNTNTI